MHWWIIVLISLGLACSKTEAPPPVEPEPATSDTEAAKDEVPSESTEQPARTEAAAAMSVGDPPEIQVIDPGKEPLRTLRWSIKPGLQQKLSMKTTVLTEGLIGGALTFRTHVPPMTHEIRVRAKETVPGESAHLTFKIKKVSLDFSEIPQKLHARMGESAKAVQGLRGSYSFEPRGLVKDAKIELPADASRTTHSFAERILWSLSHMVAPFPETPVGEGAKWSVASAIQQEGIRINQFLAVEITKLQGTLVDIKIEVEQSAPPQEFKAPTGSSERELFLSSFNAKGSVTATWDLAEVIPRSAGLEDMSEKHVEYKVDGRPTETSSTTTLATTMGGK